MHGESGRSGEWKAQLWLSVAVGVSAFLLYANTIGHGYVLDDTAVIVENAFVQRGLDGLGLILSKPYWAGFSDQFQESYRPLSLVTFALEKQFLGSTFKGPEMAKVGHLVSVCLYALTCGLLHVLFGRWLGPRRAFAALAASLLFAMHPLHTEVVANIKSRDEILAVLFVLVTLLAADRHARQGGLAVWGIGCVAFFFASFAKENALAFVVIVPLAVSFFVNPGRRRLIQTSSIVIPGALIYMAARIAVLGSVTGMASAAGHTRVNNVLFDADGPAEALATALSFAAIYARLLIWPTPLVHDYSIGQLQLVTFGQAIPWLVLSALGLGVAVVLRGAPRRQPLAFAVLFFLLTYFVVSNLIVNVVGTAVAERFMYLPSIAFCLSLGLGLARLPRQAGLAILAILLVPMGYGVIDRNRDWRDSYTLVRADLSHAPANTRIVKHLSGVVIEESNRVPGKRAEILEQALASLEASRRIYESDPTHRGLLGLELTLAAAQLQAAQGEWEPALRGYDRVLSAAPDRARVHYGRAQILVELKRDEEAKEAFRQAVQLEPTHATAWLNFGSCLTRIAARSPERREDLHTRARQAYEQAARNRSCYATAYFNLAIVLNRMQEGQASRAAAKKAVQCDARLRTQLAPLLSGG